MNIFKNEEDYKNLVSEVSALSGYPQNVVKEVFEYLLIDWAIKIVDKPEGAEIEIPYLGKVFIKYKGDTTVNNKLQTDVASFIALRDSFKNFVGELHDEGYTELVPLIQKKIENAVLIASEVLD